MISSKVDGLRKTLIPWVTHRVVGGLGGSGFKGVSNAGASAEGASAEAVGRQMQIELARNKQGKSADNTQKLLQSALTLAEKALQIAKKNKCAKIKFNDIQAFTSELDTDGQPVLRNFINLLFYKTSLAKEQNHQSLKTMSAQRFKEWDGSARAQFLNEEQRAALNRYRNEYAPQYLNEIMLFLWMVFDCASLEDLFSVREKLRGEKQQVEGQLRELSVAEKKEVVDTKKANPLIEQLLALTLKIELLGNVKKSLENCLGLAEGGTVGDRMFTEAILLRNGEKECAVISQAFWGLISGLNPNDRKCCIEAFFNKHSEQQPSDWANERLDSSGEAIYGSLKSVERRDQFNKLLTENGGMAIVDRKQILSIASRLGEKWDEITKIQPKHCPPTWQSGFGGTTVDMETAVLDETGVAGLAFPVNELVRSDGKRGSVYVGENASSLYRHKHMKPWYEQFVDQVWRKTKTPIQVFSLMGDDEKAKHGDYLCDNKKLDGMVEIKKDMPLWPDHGIVSVEELKELVEKIEVDVKNGKSILIHCLAGRGRSGVVAAAYLLYLETQKPKGAKQRSLIERTKWLREQRYGMVDTKEQFLLLIEYAQSLGVPIGIQGLEKPAKQEQIYKVPSDARGVPPPVVPVRPSRKELEKLLQEELQLSRKKNNGNRGTAVVDTTSTKKEPPPRPPRPSKMGGLPGEGGDTIAKKPVAIVKPFPK